jgi:hypothetical protein
MLSASWVTLDLNLQKSVNLSHCYFFIICFMSIVLSHETNKSLIYSLCVLFASRVYAESTATLPQLWSLYQFAYHGRMTSCCHISAKWCCRQQHSAGCQSELSSSRTTRNIDAKARSDSYAKSPMTWCWTQWKPNKLPAVSQLQNICE